MNIIPIASDSLGTRSMATFVETKDCNILIDPGVSLAPRRYNLPPHPIELERESQHWLKIKEFASQADVLILTHYHYDHHNPSEPEIFEGKVALLKHPQQNINRSQRERAAYFLKELGKLPKEIHFSDGGQFSFGQTKVKFSPAVYHGTSPRLGYVTQVCVEEELRFLHTSDVEGPAVEDQVSFILTEDPEILLCDGPMTYMLGFRYSQESLDEAVKNLVKITENTQVKKIVLDHHFLRDLKWQQRIGPVFEAAERKGTKVLTAAQFAGLENDLLEARRRELYER